MMVLVTEMTAVVLVVVHINQMKNYLKFMKKETSEYRKFFILMFLFSLAMFAINLVATYLSKNLIKNIFNNINNEILKISILMFFSYILVGFMMYYSGMLHAFLGNNIKHKLQLKVYDIFQRSSYIQIIKRTSGETYYTIFKDAVNIVDYYLLLVLNFPIKIIITLTSAFLMIVISYKMGIFLMFFSVLNILVLCILKKPIKKYTIKKRQSEHELICQINEDFLNNELNRSLGLEKQFLNNIEKKFLENKNDNLNYVSFSLISGNILNFIVQIVNFSALFLGFFLVKKQDFTIPNLFLIFILTRFFSNSLQEVVGNFPLFQLAKLSYQKYINELKIFDNKQRCGSKKFSLQKNLIFKKINFCFGEHKIFDNFNCIFDANKINLILGKNGSGKTTLLKLIKRFLYADDGEILFDDLNIIDFEYESFKNNVIYMSPNDTILKGTFLFNIVLFSKYTPNEVSDIINECNLQPIIDKLENGINGEIELSNNDFSDGEKKKLSLARILIRKPKLLLLDEFTTHLDESSINDIIKSINEYQKKNKCTIIMVSHDKRVEKIADKVIRL